MAVDKPTASDLYRQHAPWAMRVAYLLTGEEQAAQDLVHDAFVKILGRPRSLSRIDDFKPFLRTTLANLSHSRLRRLRLERGQHHTAEVMASPDEQMAEKDRTRRALQLLPPRQRTAVVLRYFEGLNEQETADAMGITVPAAKSLVQRGMRTLRKQLEGTQ